MHNKKILLIFDNNYFPEQVLGMAAELCRSSSSFVTGVFIHDLSYLYMTTGLAMEPQPYEFSLDVITDINKEELREIGSGIRRFSEYCQQHGIPFNVHLDRGMAAVEMMRESLYADLIMVGYPAFFSGTGAKGTGELLEDLLTQSYCPVLILPEKQVSIEEVLFIYDHTEASMMAIRQFAALFGEQFKEKKFSLLEQEKEHKDEKDSRKMIKEYLELHFPGIHYRIISENLREEMFRPEYAEGRQLFVMPVRERSFFSRLFSPNGANDLLKEANIPVFITHH
jgi:hypothetical protein